MDILVRPGDLDVGEFTVAGRTNAPADRLWC